MHRQNKGQTFSFFSKADKRPSKGGEICVEEEENKNMKYIDHP